MTLKDKIVSALNKQINEELFSSYLYLSMSAWFESQNLKGFAGWMRAQSREEREHAMRIFDFVHEAGGTVQLAALAAPRTKWSGAVEVFEETCAHEAKITALINGLVDLAASEKDHATANMLQWFVAEQVEEEANASDILAKLKMIGSSMGSLLYLDKALGKRDSKDD